MGKINEKDYSSKNTLKNISEKLEKGYSFTLKKDTSWMKENFQKGDIIKIQDIHLKKEGYESNTVIFQVISGGQKTVKEFSGKVFLKAFINELPETDIVYKETEKVKKKVEKITK